MAFGLVSCFVLAWFLADADPRTSKSSRVHSTTGCCPFAEGVTPPACKKRSAAHGPEATASPADMDSVLANLKTVHLADPDQQAAVQQQFEREDKAAKDGRMVEMSQTAKRYKVPMSGHDSSDDESSSGEEDKQEDEEQGDNVGEEKVQEEAHMAFV